MKQTQLSTSNLGFEYLELQCDFFRVEASVPVWALWGTRNPITGNEQCIAVDITWWTGVFSPHFFAQQITSQALIQTWVEPRMISEGKGMMDDPRLRNDITMIVTPRAWPNWKHKVVLTKLLV